MNVFVRSCIAWNCCIALAFAQVPEMPKPQEEHKLLEKFVGEWESTSQPLEAAGGEEGKECKGRGKGRMLGGFFMQADITGETPDGQKMEAVQVLGYDSAKKKYVGTWADSVMGQLWVYEGTVDGAGKVLTLNAEGPDFTQPGKKTMYRDVYEFKSPDHIGVSAWMQAPDGKWVQFMKGDMRRKK